MKYIFNCPKCNSRLDGVNFNDLESVEELATDFVEKNKWKCKCKLEYGYELISSDNKHKAVIEKEKDDYFRSWY